MNLGAHMSIAGGVHLALERGREAGCGVVQIFTRNQTRWSSPPLRPPDVERFRALKPSFHAVFAHSSYLLNLAGPDPALHARSVEGLAEELRRCAALDLGLLVLHPGSHLGTGVEAGIGRAAAGMAEAAGRAAADTGREPARILLEATSGQGNILGRSFAELRALLERLDDRGVPAGVCLDTCHLFAAGYPVHEEEGFARTMAELERLVGTRRVRAIHLNDSIGELGGHRDRHTHIGEGRIGLAGFRLFLNEPRFREVPMCLETPKGEDPHAALEEDRRNLAVLRSLRVPAPERGGQ